MGFYRRLLRGAEAGALAAAGLALAFFVLDLVRLQPLATPGALSGAVTAPGGLTWNFTSFAGIVSALTLAYRLAAFTLVHFLTFAIAGALSSLLFDWSRPGGFTRALAVVALSGLAFTASIAWAKSLSAVGSVGLGWLALMTLGAAFLLGGVLRLASAPEPEEETSATQ